MGSQTWPTKSQTDSLKCVIKKKHISVNVSKIKSWPHQSSFLLLFHFHEEWLLKLHNAENQTFLSQKVLPHIHQKKKKKRSMTIPTFLYNFLTSPSGMWLSAVFIIKLHFTFSITMGFISHRGGGLPQSAPRRHIREIKASIPQTRNGPADPVNHLYCR